MLPGGHFEPVPGGLRNIVGGLPGREPAIVLGAHYDTTPVPGYLGANNSATGVGAVIELARDLASIGARGGRAVRFVLFDGEEAPAGFTDFLAQALAAAAPTSPRMRAPRARWCCSTSSRCTASACPASRDPTPPCGRACASAAAQAGAGGYFPSATARGIFDDHTPFAQAGIPAVDLIDFDYPCWQRTCDDLSQVSQASLAAIGSSVLDLVRTERARR